MFLTYLACVAAADGHEPDYSWRRNIPAVLSSATFIYSPTQESESDWVVVFRHQQRGLRIPSDELVWFLQNELKVLPTNLFIACV